MKTLNHMVAIFLLSMVSHSAAEEIINEEFGFRFVVPAGFAKAPISPQEKNTLHKYTKSEGAEAAIVMVMQIQRLHGVIDPAQSMAGSVPALFNGVAPIVQPFVWRGSKLETLRLSQPLPDGRKFIVDSIQFPLNGEAVQLQLGGLEEQEREVRSLFEDAASKFINTRPLHGSASADSLRTEPLSERESRVRLIEGLERFAAVGVGIGALIYFGIKSRRNKGTKSA
jgi:hypothetical protein